MEQSQKAGTESNPNSTSPRRIPRSSTAILGPCLITTNRYTVNDGNGAYEGCAGRRRSAHSVPLTSVVASAGSRGNKSAILLSTYPGGVNMQGRTTAYQCNPAAMGAGARRRDLKGGVAGARLLRRPSGRAETDWRGRGVGPPWEKRWLVWFIRCGRVGSFVGRNVRRGLVVKKKKSYIVV